LFGQVRRDRLRKRARSVLFRDCVHHDGVNDWFRFPPELLSISIRSLPGIRTWLAIEDARRKAGAVEGNLLE
jgi:hypothetical protein